MRVFLFMFLFLTAKLFSQNSFVYGKVECDGVPVPFASIGLRASSIATTSDVKGKFILSNIPEGSYELIISSVGYEKYRENIKLKSSDTLFLAIKLKSSQFGLNEVVITGTMKESFVSQSPVKVEVITSQFLKKNPTNNIMEAIQTVNGVQEQINCGVCSTSDIHINGMEGPYTLVLIDGMPIMSALSTVYGLNGIPTSLIDRIEIIKGPSSTLYGTEAVAGVINVITKKPENSPSFSINTFATSHLEKNIDFSISSILGKVSTLFSGNAYHMNNFIDENGDDFSDVTLVKRISLFTKTSVKRKDNKKMMISGKYYFEDRFGGTSAWTKEFRGSDSIYGESIYTQRVEAIGSFDLPIKQKVRFDFSYNNHIQDSYYGSSNYKAIQSTFFSNLVLNTQIGTKNDIVAGLSSRFNSYNDNTPATPTTDNQVIPGIFIQDEITFSEKYTSLLGIRYDYHKNHGNIFSPRINFKWKPKIYTTLRLNAGTGFRVVNLFTEDHAALTGARKVIIQEKLNPEQSYNINLNINQILAIGKSSASFDADVFYTYFENKIIPDYLTDSDLIIYSNLNGYSVSRGASLAVQQSFVFPLKYSIGATFLDVFYTEYNPQGKLVKQPEIFAPIFSAVFACSYQFKKIKLSVDYTGRVVGPMALPTYPAPFSRDEVSEYFSLQNIQFTKNINNKFEVYFGVKNILDYVQESPLIDYKNPFGENFDTAYAYGPTQGRRYFIGVRWSIDKKIVQ